MAAGKARTCEAGRAMPRDCAHDSPSPLLTGTSRLGRILAAGVCVGLSASACIPDLPESESGATGLDGSQLSILSTGSSTGIATTATTATASSGDSEHGSASTSTDDGASGDTTTDASATSSGSTTHSTTDGSGSSTGGSSDSSGSDDTTASEDSGDTDSQCPDGLMCDAECIDPQVDPQYCGAKDDCMGIDAGDVCESGEICRAGQCEAACGGQKIACEGSCIDPDKDPWYCGAKLDCIGNNAGQRCRDDQRCDRGACECPSGRIDCEGSCIDPELDKNHCGARADCRGPNAGQRCQSNEVCSGGRCASDCPTNHVNCEGSCIDPRTSWKYCGARNDCMGNNAGETCATGEVCDNGNCNCTQALDCLDMCGGNAVSGNLDRFGTSPKTETLDLSAATVLRHLVLPANARVSAAQLTLRGLGERVFDTAERRALPIDAPDRAHALAYFPEDDGRSFWYGESDSGGLTRIFWDGSSEGSRIQLPSSLNDIYDCDIDDGRIFCITCEASDGPDAPGCQIETFDRPPECPLMPCTQAAPEAGTPVLGFDPIADMAKLSGHAGVYGLTVDERFIYVAGGHAGNPDECASGCRGQIIAYDKFTGEQIASVAADNGSLWSGIDHAKLALAPTDDGPVDCSGGCLFLNQWQPDAGTGDVISVYSRAPALSFLGSYSLGVSNAENTGLMVSSKLSADDPGDSGVVMMLGHAGSAEISRYHAQLIMAEYPMDGGIRIGGQPSHMLRSPLDTTVVLDGLADDINAALNGGACDCADCQLMGGRTCLLPFYFFAESGRLLYEGLEVEYCGGF